MGSLIISLNTVWVLLTGAMVFLMEGGFAALEAGFVRSKNAMNVVMKVFMDSSLGILGFFLVGFAVMFGPNWMGILGTGGFALRGVSFLSGLPPWALWFFEAGFAIAMVSIVSGAVAERMRFSPYMVFAFLGTALIYPVAGHWVWGPGGWLGALGMRDYAGSAVVHAAGGAAALAAIILLGPRRGKYNADGSANVLPASNLPLAAAGAFILWFGWFGFNAGSSLAATNSDISLVAANTLIASAVGGVLGTLWTMLKYKKADPSMTINGVLAGLVAVTAPCAYVSPAGAAAIGLVAGVLVVEAVGWVDRAHLDDPVGAVAVHGFGGAFGTLSVGLFAIKGGLFYGGGLHSLLIQALGLVCVAGWSFVATYGLFYLLKRTVGIRVSADEEDQGLDIGEHGVPAYAHGWTEPNVFPSDLSQGYPQVVRHAVTATDAAEGG